MSSEVIVYEYEFVEKLAEVFHAELDESILNKLLEIKKNNKFIRRQSPLRLSYKTTAADTWRKSRILNDVDVDSGPRAFDKELISNLNKISEQNYENIFTRIKSIYDSIEIIDDRVIFINTICNKAMTETIYSKLYARLISDINSNIIDVVESGELNGSEQSISKIVLNICNNFFKEFNNMSLEELHNVNDYAKLCEITKMKAHLTGGYIFIANLYKNNIVSHDIVNDYYGLLVLHTKESSDEYIGKYIDAIVNILDNCGAKLQTESPETFKETYMDICYNLISEKKTLLPKYKFKLMDICDKYANKWDVKHDEWIKS